MRRTRGREAERGEEDILGLLLPSGPMAVAVVLVHPGRPATVALGNEALDGLAGRTVLGQPVGSLVHEDDRQVLQRALERVGEGRTGAEQIEVRLIDAERRVRHVRMFIARLPGAAGGGGGTSRLLVHLVDLTVERVATAALDAAQQRFHAAFEFAPSGMAIVDADGRLTHANRRLCAMLGREETALREPGGRAAMEALLAAASAPGEDVEIRRPDGCVVWLSVENVVLDVPCAPGCRLIQVEDRTEGREVRERLEQLALTDELTGLANRRRLRDHLERRVAGARRYDHSGAILMFDLDGLKEINDTHGHRAGDEALVAVARCLRSRVRDSDLAARLGGDEFVVLLDCVDMRGARRVAADVVDAVARTGAELGLPLSTSAGIALVDGSQPADAVLESADTALYAAKASGGNGVRAESARWPRVRRDARPREEGTLSRAGRRGRA